MMKIVLCFIFCLLFGCDSISNRSDIPGAFKAEEVVYEESIFPSCYAAAIRVTQESDDHFKRSSNDFRLSKTTHSRYREWQKTPIPSEFLTDDYEGLEVALYYAIENGMGCQSGKSESEMRYYSTYWKALESEGAYYTNTTRGFILYIPEQRLLYYSYAGH